METGTLVTGIAVSGFGLANAILEWPKIREGVRSLRWPSALGHVTSSEFQDGPLTGRFIRTTTGRAAVTYQYEINGRKMTGTRVFVGDEDVASAYEAQRRVRHYYPGVSVQVYYHPADPSRAVLERGLTWTHGWQFFLGILIMIAGGVVVASS